MTTLWRDRQGSVSPAKLVALLVATIPGLSLVYDWMSGAFGPLPVTGFVYWSGVWAAGLLLAAMATTPASRILGWSRLLEGRRIIGVSALAYTILHTLGYFALYRWDWNVLLNQMATRVTLYVAIASLLGILALGLTSTDWAINRIGPRNWRRLHAAGAFLTALAIGHFLLSPGIFSAQYVMTGALFWLIAWRRIDARTGVLSPLRHAALAIGIASLAFCFQVAWLWAYQGVPPVETIRDTISFEDEIAAIWIVLCGGLGVALVSAAVHAPQAAGPSQSTIAALADPGGRDGT